MVKPLGGPGPARLASDCLAGLTAWPALLNEGIGERGMTNAPMPRGRDGGTFDRCQNRTVVVTRRRTFAAAHKLCRPDWDELENGAVYGTCVNDHGHNYVLEVSVRGEPDSETGMVINLRDLDRMIGQAIIDRVDHRHLNRDVD